MNNQIAQMVYNQLMGYEEQQHPMLPVENLFAEGAACDALYEEIYAANLRLCQRLGVEEDGDVQLILERSEQINRLVAEKMFHYATCLATRCNGKL